MEGGGWRQLLFESCLRILLHVVLLTSQATGFIQDFPVGVENVRYM